MLKKILTAQIVLLLIEIVIGIVLVNQFETSTKLVHGLIGTAVVLSSLATAYFAFKEKSSKPVLGLTVGAVVLVSLAFIGGRMAETNYDQGLMLMRSTAFLSFAVCLVAYYLLRRPSPHKTL